MMITKRADALAESLLHLEEHLELPYVSGELHDWSQRLQQLISDATEKFRAEVASEHGQAYQAIVKNNRNLCQEVDKLRGQDVPILAELESVRQQVDRFSSAIDETVLAGQQFEPKREQLISAGLAAVLRVRRHRAAIDTWMGEALQRDNGVGD